MERKIVLKQDILELPNKINEVLKLNDEIKENYNGSATLVITEKAIRNQKLNEMDMDMLLLC